MKYKPDEDQPTENHLSLDYKAVTWGPLSAVVLAVVFFLLSQILGSILLIIGAIVFDGQTFDSLQAKDGPLASTAYQFIGNVLVAGSLLFLLSSYLKHRKSSFKALGLKRIHLSDTWRALLGYGLYFSGFLIISVALHAWRPDILNQDQDIGFDRAASGLKLLPIFFSLVIVPPLIEELLVRGFLFSGLRTRLSFLGATVVTSLMFAAAHLQWGSAAPLVWAAAADTFVLSLVLCWLRERTGRLWAPIMLHGLKNGLAFASIFLFKLS